MGKEEPSLLLGFALALLVWDCAMWAAGRIFQPLPPFPSLVPVRAGLGPDVHCTFIKSGSGSFVRRRGGGWLPSHVFFTTALA